MTDDEKKEEENVTQRSSTKKVIKVTSNVSIDFPSLDWGINAGMDRELPVDEVSQKIILENDNIKIVK